MKESGTIIAFIVLTIAVAISLHKDGLLFNPNEAKKVISSFSNPVSNSSQSLTGGKIYPPQDPPTNESAFSDRVYLSDIKDPGRLAVSEYVTIRVSGNDTPINITGWSLESTVTGNKIFIGGGYAIPQEGVAVPILVKGGSEIIVATGNSPLKYSFQTNICTGYFEEKMGFLPSLPMQCPMLYNEEMPERVEDSDVCQGYINSFKRCETRARYQSNEDDNIPQYCEDFVDKTVSYENCVRLHRNDKYFLTSEWRVFLNSRVPLWKSKRETIRLLDTQGKIVDTLTY